MLGGAVKSLLFKGRPTFVRKKPGVFTPGVRYITQIATYRLCDMVANALKATQMVRNRPTSFSEWKVPQLQANDGMPQPCDLLGPNPHINLERTD